MRIGKRHGESAPAWSLSIALLSFVVIGSTGRDMPRPDHPRGGSVTVIASDGAASAFEQGQGGYAGLVDVVQRLERAFQAFMDGDDAAFEPWHVEVVDRQALRAGAGERGATRFVTAPFEFELIFEKAAQPVYYLRTGVFVHGDDIGFLQFGGRDVRGQDFSLPREPFAGYAGEAASFGEAGQTLAQTVLRRGCDEVPLPAFESVRAFGQSADIPSLARLTPDAWDGDARQRRSGIRRTCAAIVAIAPSDVTLRLDDYNFFGVDGDGRFRGLILGTIRARRGGAMTIEIEGWDRG